MNTSITMFFLAALIVSCGDNSDLKETKHQTICNPVNLSYRFQPDLPSRREAADPSVIVFRDEYYLFASKSGGYWHSDNLVDWVFIESNEIPTEEYAPTAIAIADTLYFLASSRVKSTIYKTGDPLSGQWNIANEELDEPVWDPAFYMDDDNRLYLYWGCSNETPIYGIELDYGNNFSFIGDPEELIFANPAEYGWEVPGDYNMKKEVSPWIEGAWMNKYGSKYYLQYSGPGTEFKSYSDGVYTADNPLGPYQVAPHNPFAYKPEGFAAGAGHGSTFADSYGNYWHIGTITISQKHMFERRLGIFPTFFDEDGTLHTVTKYGDYPFIVPQKKIEKFEDVFPGWMLLSYMKNVVVSSSVDTLAPENMTDEDIRTNWAAESGEPNEYASIDLGEPYDVYAVQINFAEHQTELFGREAHLRHQFLIEYSNDNKQWDILVDKSNNQSDRSHDYIQLPEKVHCRYLKIKNISMPDGHFALSGFRVFGKGNGDVPEEVSNFDVKRDPEDKRTARLSWEKSEDATGYIISYGSDKNRLYHNYMVYQDTDLVVNSLNASQNYYFNIETFNENGRTPSEEVVFAD